MGGTLGDGSTTGLAGDAIEQGDGNNNSSSTNVTTTVTTNTDLGDEKQQQQSDSSKDEEADTNTGDAGSDVAAVPAAQQPFIAESKPDPPKTISVEEDDDQVLFGQDHNDSDNLFGETESSVSNNETNTPDIAINSVEKDNNKLAEKKDGVIEDSSNDIKDIEEEKVQTKEGATENEEIDSVKEEEPTEKAEDMDEDENEDEEDEDEDDDDQPMMSPDNSIFGDTKSETKQLDNASSFVETPSEISDAHKNVQEETINKTEDINEKEDAIEEGNEHAKDNINGHPEDADTKIKLTTKTEPETFDIPQAHEIVIPSYSKWFSLDKIHSIEIQSLPEFFTNRIPSKTPEVYMRYRNFMVNSYRLNPNEYFSVTTARRNVSGDAAALFRLHKFLTKWGLINYQVDSKLLPKNIEPPLTSQYSTRHDAPRGLFPFESYKPSIQLPDMAKLKKMMNTSDSESTLYKYLKESKRKYDDISRLSNTPDNDNGDKSNKNIEKSPDESDENLLEYDETSRPLKKIKILEQIDKNWSKEDLQKLLKGIQEFGADWYKVAKHVGTKSPEQCILRFLQLPIEDKFLYGDGNTKGANESGLGPLKYAPHLPFSKGENPVLSTIAFLVGLVNPKTVQAMTQRAIQSEETIESQKKEISDKGSFENVKEGSEIALSSLGLRSHVFATHEERQMNLLTNELIRLQMEKLDSKLNHLKKIESFMELERKTLERQQENLLIQRLNFNQNSNKIVNVLTKCLNSISDSNIDNSSMTDRDEIRSQINHFRNMLSKPESLSIGKNPFGKSNIETGETLNEQNTSNENDVKPISIEAPQFYRYWSA
ncbi:transcription factor [Saccharomyces pastorianus]|uniref:Transcription factor n=1 Tax=Saccharomyces pastorianus TaxID=27292 RepID=A0A6C1EBH5_SACPS|nr:transcription factor [Saccharomyces pastorianus]